MHHACIFVAKIFFVASTMLVVIIADIINSTCFNDLIIYGRLAKSISLLIPYSCCCYSFPM